MIGLLWVLVYLAIASFAVATYRMNEAVLNAGDPVKTSDQERRRRDYGLLLIAIYAVLFALLNLLCTKTSAAYGSDRVNYLTEYSGERKSSVGLELVFYLFRFTTNNYLHLLLFTTFSCLLIVLIAHRLFEGGSWISLAFFFTTDFVFFTFTGLKQSYACALIALAFALLMKERTVRTTVVCFLLVGIAVLFHVASLVMIPLFVLCCFERIGKPFLIGGAVLMLLGVVFFTQIGSFVLGVAQHVSPRFAELQTRYFSDLGWDWSSASVCLKGTPFYMLFGFGCYFRKKVGDKCALYDKYLIVLAAASALYLCSVHVYWMIRFGAFFYLPAAVFFGILFRNVSKKERIVLSVCTFGVSLVLLIRWVLAIYQNWGGF